MMMMKYTLYSSSGVGGDVVVNLVVIIIISLGHSLRICVFVKGSNMNAFNRWFEMETACLRRLPNPQPFFELGNRTRYATPPPFPCRVSVMQMSWSWLLRITCGRRLRSTAETSTVTWWPSPLKSSNTGIARGPGGPPPLTCGWDSPTPAHWTSGSGWVRRARVSATGLLASGAGERSVKWRGPWTQLADTSGSAVRSQTDSTSSVRNIPVSLNGFEWYCTLRDTQAFSLDKCVLLSCWLLLVVVVVVMPGLWFNWCPVTVYLLQQICVGLTRGCLFVFFSF